LYMNGRDENFIKKMLISNHKTNYLSVKHNTTFKSQYITYKYKFRLVIKSSSGCIS